MTAEKVSGQRRGTGIESVKASEQMRELWEKIDCLEHAFAVYRGDASHSRSRIEAAIADVRTLLRLRAVH